MRGSEAVSSNKTMAEGAPRVRSGGSRRNLPTGRALVGGLLVTIAAVLVFAAYAGAQAGPRSEVVVASKDLGVGERITASDLEVRSVDLPDDLRSEVFADTTDLIGSVTLGPVGAGEMVPRASVLTEVAGRNPAPEFSFPVDRERAVNGEIRSGETVDLLATFGTGADSYTSVLARSARVLRVEDGGRGTLGGPGTLVLTVAMDSPDQVLDVAHASQVAAITVVRSTSAVGTSAAPSRDRTSSADASKAGPS